MNSPRVDPVPQLLGRGRLGVGEAAGAEHGDQQLDMPQFTRAPVDQHKFGLRGLA